MLKDIPKNIVENIAIAVVNEEDEGAVLVWNVYFLNLKNEKIENVLVTSRGYGTFEKDSVKTTTLRHSLGDIEPQNYKKIELIIDKLFGLNNEYWISFFLKGTLYDKKYVFLPESIIEAHLTNIPLINKKGVMIK